jgi:ATP-dependent RNA helicase RhlE
VNFDQLSLDARVLAGVQVAGYTTPTPIQQQAIPVVLRGQDVLGLAQTGTGKTAAFMLPILHRLSTQQAAPRRVRALVVAPTRELAEQIHQSTIDLGKHTKVRSTAIYGGVSKGPQIASLLRGSEIVVATPGRLLDHLDERSIDLSNVEVLVLDEADRMCDMGFLPDIRRILEHVPARRQTLFFSATMPDDIRTLADSILRNPVTVQVDVIAPAKTVSHALYPVPEKQKTRFLLTMLDHTPTGRVLVFTRTKRRARFLAADLDEAGYRVAALQGNMTQNRRQEAIDGFRGGKYDILVATDIAARGIDVAEISHVINYDMPDTVDAYTHRIGRTGRADLTGEAFTFVGPDDELMVRDIERVLGKRIERRRLAEFEYGTLPVTTMAQPVKQPSAKIESQPQRTRSPQRPSSPRPAGQPAQPRPHGAAGQSRSPRQAPATSAGAQPRKEGVARRRREGQQRQPYAAQR